MTTTQGAIIFYRSHTENHFRLIVYLDRQDLRMSLSPVSKKFSEFFFENFLLPENQPILNQYQIAKYFFDN